MSNVSLAALHVLVTRLASQPVLPSYSPAVSKTAPQQSLEQQELVAAIEAAAGHALHLPLISIKRFTPQDKPSQLIGKIQNLDNYQILIFVSTNAVQHGVFWIEQYWPQFPVGIQLVAIGPATARALTAALHQDVVYADTGVTSEDLLQHPLFTDVQRKRIGIVRGVGGRELLAESLVLRGAVVDYLEVYERNLMPYPSRDFCEQLRMHGINVLTVSSGESLLHLAELLGDNKAELSLLPLVVPSQRVAEQARTLGFSHVIQAGGADVASTMTALKELAAGFRNERA